MLSLKLPRLFRIDQVPQVSAFLPADFRVCSRYVPAVWDFRLSQAPSLQGALPNLLQDPAPLAPPMHQAGKV